MADIRFACPHCEQHIQAEPGYAGMQISCPSCHGPLTVPGAPVSAVAVPAPAYVASYGASSVAHAAPAAVAVPVSAAARCPSCGGALARGAVLCIQCGYNIATGQRTVAGRPAALGKPGTPQWETPWYKTAYPYLGVVLVVLAALYYLGRENPPMMLAFIGTAALYTLTAHIIVTVAAFRESIGTGFLTLCVPFYALYFVFKVSESDTLKLLYASAVIVNISLRFLTK